MGLWTKGSRSKKKLDEEKWYRGLMAAQRSEMWPWATGIPAPSGSCILEPFVMEAGHVVVSRISAELAPYRAFASPTV